MTDAPNAERDAGRSPSRVALILALVVGLGVGLGIAALLLRDGGDSADDGSTGAAPTPAAAEDAAELSVPLPEPDPIIPVAEATTPEAALRGFLAAESQGEWEASWELLTDEVKDLVHPTAAAWVNAHADFPRITGYRVDSVELDEASGEATAMTLTAYDATLDPIIGLVPPRGRTTWRLVEAPDGTWRVDSQATSDEALYIGEASAGPVVRSWVDARVACEDTADLESGLIGSPVLAQALCDEDQPEPVEIGPIRALQDSSETTPLISEFGPEVFSWARTARVEASTPFIAVLAPVGEEWKVVAVLRAL